MDENKFYSKEISWENLSTIKIISKWTLEDVDQKADLILICNNSLWYGSIYLEEVNIFANHLSITLSEYFEIMKASFTSDMGPDNDLFKFENHVLEWSKVFEDELCLMYGKFTLTQNNSIPLYAEVVSCLLTRNETLSSELENIEFQKTLFEEEIQKLHSTIEEMISFKNDMEDRLYSSFLRILNEKKKKNLELKEKLEEKQSLLSSTSMASKPGCSKYS